MESNKKALPDILFIGGFANKSLDGGYGGQIFASRSIVNSSLKDFVNWKLIDSTSELSKNPSITDKLVRALKRFLLLNKFIFSSKIKLAIIFSSHGFGFIEKGFYCRYLKLWSIPVAFFPRSGIIQKNISNSKFYRKFATFTLNNIDILLCQSNYWKNYYDGISENCKKIVCENWIDLNNLNGINLLKPDKPDKSGNTSFKILYLGKLDQNKGIFETINIIRLLSDNNKSVVITIGGRGPDEILMKKKIQELKLEKYFNFLGWVDHKEKINLFSSHDCLLLSSHFEGFPNVILESILYKTSVVASNVGSVGDIIKDGYNGLLFEPKNVLEAVKKIELLIDNPNLKQQFVDNSYIRLLEKNTLEHAVNIFKSIIKSYE